jgi:hypothetical protein
VALADTKIGIISTVVGGVLACLNAWAIYTINDIKSDVREIRGTVNNTSVALTGQMTNLEQVMGRRIDTISATGAQTSASSASDLAKAVLETRTIVGKIEAETVSTAKEVDVIRVDVSNLTQTVAFMQGQVSHAPWVEK